MGILGLSRLIADVCPEAIKEVEIGSFFGRRIAIDASMSIYQFLIAIRNNSEMMTNSDGETTSHLIGLFYRTCKLLEGGIKPVYVFDGCAPHLKGKELEKRKERRAEATKSLEAADNPEDVAKFSKRLVRVTRQHNEECKKLLTLMGVPIVTAPSEAEAQCAQLCKEGLVYAVATEDMDGLTFGASRLIRSLSAGGSGEKCKEYVLDKVLTGLGLSYLQFVDLCILMGCDYCSSIRGIGGKKGLDVLKKYGSIEELLKEKYQISEFVDVDISYDQRKRNLEAVDEVNEDEDVKKELNGEGEHETKTEDDSKDLEAAKDADDKVKEEAEKAVSNGADAKIKDENSEDEDEAREILKDGIEDSEKSDDGDEKDELESEGKEKEKKKKKKTGKKKAPRNPLDDVPQDWLFKGARKLFLEPNVDAGKLTEADVRLREIDEEGLIKFLCEEQGFSEDRVKSGIKRIKAAKGKSNQTRIDSFFAAKPSPGGAGSTAAKSAKRPAPAKSAGGKRGKRPR